MLFLAAKSHRMHVTSKLSPICVLFFIHLYCRLSFICCLWGNKLPFGSKMSAVFWRSHFYWQLNGSGRGWCTVDVESPTVKWQFHLFRCIAIATFKIPVFTLWDWIPLKHLCVLCLSGCMVPASLNALFSVLYHDHTMNRQTYATILWNYFSSFSNHPFVSTINKAEKNNLRTLVNSELLMVSVVWPEFFVVYEVFYGTWRHKHRCSHRPALFLLYYFATVSLSLIHSTTACLNIVYFLFHYSFIVSKEWCNLLCATVCLVLCWISTVTTYYVRNKVMVRKTLVTSVESITKG